MERESYTVREASRALGLSAPTVIRMCEEGTLACFETPGGHRRIPSEALAAVRTSGRPRASSVSLPSGPLQARRERVEELNLEGQELRARRELERLRAEQTEEAERRTSVERATEADREERREQARAERLRQERLREEADAEQRRARLRQQVQLALNVTLSADVPFEKQRALADALEAELSRAKVEDAETAIPVIKAVTDRFRVSWVADERAQQRRARILEWALREISWTRGSTEADEAEAANGIRATLSALAPDATEREIRCAAEAVIPPIRKNIEERMRRKELIESGVQEVVPYLERLHRAGGIPGEMMADGAFVTALRDSVRSRLQDTSASEGLVQMRHLVHEVVDQELDRLV